MAEIKVAESDELAIGTRKLCEVAGRRAVLIRCSEKEFIAFDNHCPHRGGPVGAGPIDDGRLTCPWHGLAFELPSGEGCGHGQSLSKLALEIRPDGVYLSDTPATPRNQDQVVYLVRYASAAHVGKFASNEASFQRGDCVLLQTDRGQELGEVLAKQAEIAGGAAITGQLLRTASAEERAASEASQVQLEPLLEAVRELLTSSVAPTHLLEAELLFDQQTVILYHLGPSIEILGRIAAELGEQHGFRFQFESLAESAPKPRSGRPSSSGDDEVKGPYERLKHDLRRLWECPVCGRHERWSGDVTTVLCPCQKKEPLLAQQWMKMIAEGGKP